MPWRETCAMDERVRFMGAVLEEKDTFAEICRQYGISTNVGYKLKRRYMVEGLSGLVERSRAPKRHSNQTPDAVVERILELKRRPDFKNAGPKKLVAWLQRSEPSFPVPAPSTVGVILERHGLTARRYRRRGVARHQLPEAPDAAPNALWTIDHKGEFWTGNGRRCVPLTLQDHFSRYLLKVHATTSTSYRQLEPILRAAFAEFGLPDAIRSDNGSPFASRAPGGLTCFGVLLAQLGIRHERIEPGHPEQNGRHERMHRTLKAETARPPRGTISEQQRAFWQFHRFHNNERPHEALGLRPPADFYTPSERAMPRRIALPEYTDNAVVRRVSDKGIIAFAGRQAYVGSRLAKELVGAVELERGVWRIEYYAVLVGHVDFGASSQRIPAAR